MLSRSRNDASCPAPNDAGHPWAIVEEHHGSNILLLDGPRGVGKTTALVSAIKMWKENKDLRVLNILDFDPMPPGLPVHAWLLQGWKPVQDYLDHQRCGRTDGRLRDDEVRWDAVLRHSVTAWSTSQAARDSSLLDNALDGQQRVNEWLSLARTFARFIDGVKHELSKMCAVGKQVLFIQPIDDMDVQWSCAVDVLHAMQLFRHPNLVYVLTGESKLLLDALVETHAARMKVWERRDRGDAMPERLQLVKDVAGSILEKSIPPHHRFRVDLLTLGDALKLEDPANPKKRIDETEVDSKSLWRKSWDKLIDLARDEKINGVPVGTARRFIQGLEGRHGEPVARIFQALLGVEDEGPKERPRLDFQVSCTLGGTCSVAESIPVLPDQLYVRVGHEFTFAAYDHDNGSMADWGRVLLASHLSRVSEPLVRTHGIQWEPSTFGAWTEWRSPKSAVLFWPLVAYPNEVEVASWLEGWNKELSESVGKASSAGGRRRSTAAPAPLLSESVGKALSASDLLWRWATYTLRKQGVNGEFTLGSWDPLLRAVDKCLADARGAASAEQAATPSVEKSMTLQRWLQEMVPLMCIPEMGVGSEVQKKLFEAWRESWKDRRPPKKKALKNVRTRAVSDALTWGRLLIDGASSKVAFGELSMSDKDRGVIDLMAEADRYARAGGSSSAWDDLLKFVDEKYAKASSREGAK
jgi:hypothetical protein